MVRSTKSGLPSSLGVLSGLVAGGLVAGLALPKLLSAGRKAGRRIAGVTYRDQPSSSEATVVDPAGGRPA